MNQKCCHDSSVLANLYDSLVCRPSGNDSAIDSEGLAFCAFSAENEFLNFALGRTIARTDLSAYAADLAVRLQNWFSFVIVQTFVGAHYYACGTARTSAFGNNVFVQ